MILRFALSYNPEYAKALSERKNLPERFNELTLTARAVNFKFAFVSSTSGNELGKKSYSASIPR